MATTKKAEDFEKALRPKLPEISDRTLRMAVEEVLAYATKVEEKKELEAKVKNPRPRPEGHEFKRLAAKLKPVDLESIEQMAGREMRHLVEELLAYAKSLSKT